jgi:hypothetical protein
MLPWYWSGSDRSETYKVYWIVDNELFRQFFAFVIGYSHDEDNAHSSSKQQKYVTVTKQFRREKHVRVSARLHVTADFQESF